MQYPVVGQHVWPCLTSCPVAVAVRKARRAPTTNQSPAVWVWAAAVTRVTSLRALFLVSHFSTIFARYTASEATSTRPRRIRKRTAASALLHQNNGHRIDLERDQASADLDVDDSGSPPLFELRAPAEHQVRGASSARARAPGTGACARLLFRYSSAFGSSTDWPYLNAPVGSYCFLTFCRRS